MTLRCALFLAGGLVAGAIAGEPPDDRALIEKAAAARQGVAPVAAPASDLSTTEMQARWEVLIAQARLDLVLARQAQQAGQPAQAAARAQAALQTLAPVAAHRDVEELELQAEGILARAQRAGVPVTLGENTPPEAATADPLNRAAPPDRLDRSVRAAGQVARGYTGADRPEIDTNGAADSLRDRTLARQLPDQGGYRPGREVIDLETVLERDRQRLMYSDALQEMYRADEARLLTEVDEARVAPEREVQYPDNWPEIVAKRAKYKDGVIARSPSWADKDGREWYVAIYDIHDLTYVPPDFSNIEGLGMLPREGLQATLDREALRQRSEIFGGYAEDLAAGLPLLRFFGGVDDFALRGPKYSMERQAQIVDMIQRMTSAGAPGAMIVPVPAP